jgi:hypothetical protein
MAYTLIRFNLVDFAEAYWRDIYFTGLLDMKSPIHTHTLAGMMIEKAYREASDELRPASDKQEKSFHEKQYEGGQPNPLAEGDESVYNLAVDKLDAMLMATAAYKEKPTRVYGGDTPEEGLLVTALRRPLPEKSAPLNTHG